MTDTVGFIRKLPHQLVDAFGATLEETIHADLLVVVEDGAEPPEEMGARRRAVEGTLAEIGADDIPRLEVVNKLDLLSSKDREDLRFSRPQSLLVSAATGEGMVALLDAVAASIGSRMVTVSLLIPHSEGSVLAEIYRLAGDLKRTESESGVILRAKLRPEQAARYSRYALGASSG